MHTVTYLPAPRTCTLAMAKAQRAISALPHGSTMAMAMAAARNAAYSAARTHGVKLAKGTAPALAQVAVRRYMANGSTLAPAPKRGA